MQNGIVESRQPCSSATFQTRLGKPWLNHEVARPTGSQSNTPARGVKKAAGRRMHVDVVQILVRGVDLGHHSALAWCHKHALGREVVRRYYASCKRQRIGRRRGRSALRRSSASKLSPRGAA